MCRWNTNTLPNYWSQVHQLYSTFDEALATFYSAYVNGGVQAVEGGGMC